MLRNLPYFTRWVPGQAALNRNTVFWVLGSADAPGGQPPLLAAVVFDWTDVLRVSDYIVDAARVGTSDVRTAMLLACARYALASGAFAGNPRTPARVSGLKPGLDEAGPKDAAANGAERSAESLIVPLGLARPLGMNLAEAFEAAGKDIDELEDSAWMYR